MSTEGLENKEELNTQNNAPQDASSSSKQGINKTQAKPTQDEKEIAKQEKLKKKEEAKQAKLLKKQEKENKKGAKVEENKSSTPQKDDEESLARTDAVNEFFKTPPAGVYPKTDKQGRVIKYKKRGGVFAFFVGIFFSLFLLVFCGGLVASYFYYCYKVEDAGKMLGINTNFLSENTKNKTANEIVNFFTDYTNVTIGDMKEKLGLDIEELIKQNLGMELEDFNEIEINLDGQLIKVKDVKLKDVLDSNKGGIQEFVDAVLPEIYKKISISEIWNLANISINLDKPLINNEIFDITPNPTFVLSGTTYTINFASQVVENKEIEFATKLNNNQFTINSVAYTISTDKTKITFGDESEITLTYNHTYKKLDDITVYEVLNSIIPNYFGGESLTIGFIQNAFGLDLIDAEDPEYTGILNTSVNNLKVDQLLDAISIRAFEKLLGIDIIPLDDARYDAILAEKIGQISAASITENVTMGAFLDLLKISMPDLPVLSYEEFQNTKIKDITDYVYTLKITDFINNIIEEVHPYTYFTKDDVNYYVNTEEKEIYTKEKIVAETNSQFATINDKDVFSYRINNKNYLMYDKYFYKNEASLITSNQVEIAGITYTYDNANSKLINTETLAEIVIQDAKFFIFDGTKLVTFGIVNGSVVNYYNIKSESKVTGQIFRLNFVAGLDIGFTQDTTITYKLDKENNIEFLQTEAIINNENKFKIDGVEYEIIDENVSDGTNTYSIFEKSTTLQIALYALSDLTVKNIIDGDLKELVGDDAKLNNLLLTDVLNNEFEGVLKNLNGLTIGEIVDYPDILLDRIKDIKLAEIMNIGDDASPLLKAITNANLTLDDLIKERAPGEENPIIAAMGNVTFFELGVKNSPTYLFDENSQTQIGGTTLTINAALTEISDGTNTYAITNTLGKEEVTISGTTYRFVTDAVIGNRLVESNSYNPLMFILESVTINDIMAENGLYNIIKDISLYDLTESDSGIMKILGDITFSDFGTGDAITDKLKASNASLAELLDQQIYFYNHFEYDNNLYYFVDNLNTLNGLYVQSNNQYDITFTYNSYLDITMQTFEYEGTTYTLDLINGKLKEGNTVVQYLGNDVDITNNTFVFVNDKVFIISGSYVYELTKSTTSYVLSGNTITEFDGETVNIEVQTASTLNKAILSLKVNALFGGDFTSTLTTEVQNIKLTEILGDVSGNQLLSALTSKNPNVTISTLGSTINELTMSEVFTTTDFTTGILSLITYNGSSIANTKLLNVCDAINEFDFASQTIENLLDKGIIDFNEYDASHNVTKDRNTSIRSAYGSYTLVGFITTIYDLATS